MNKIKYELVAHPVRGGMLAIFVQCSQFGSSIELDTDVRVFNNEWSDEHGLITNNPNSANLNLLIRKLVYNLEEIELTYAGDMTLTKLHDIYSKRGTSADWYAMWKKAMHERGLYVLNNLNNPSFVQNNGLDKDQDFNNLYPVLGSRLQ